MTDSILDTTKLLIGIDPSITVFDQQIISHINSAFMVLNQLGVGPEGGFSISDNTTEWSEYTSGDTSIESVKTYMNKKVQYWFDPPQNGSAMSALENQIKELEWRLNVAVDY